MRVWVMGVSFDASSLEVREKISLPELPGVVVLKTCNRIEVYGSDEDVGKIEGLFEADYIFSGAACFSHLVSVAAGLKSAILAETAILSQVRTAYAVASERGSLPSSLHYLFQKSLKIAKDIRTRFPCFGSGHQLESLIERLADTFLGEDPSLLFIGFSEMSRRLIHFLSRRKKCKMTLVTRQRGVASFVGKYGLQQRGYEEMDRVHCYDGIISATESAGYLFSELQTPYSTQLILDLSVPRTMDPQITRLYPEIVFLNMEQLEQVFAKTFPSCEGEVAKVENFIDASVGAYVERFERRELVGVG